jgi:hypothetical protein
MPDPIGSVEGATPVRQSLLGQNPTPVESLQSPYEAGVDAAQAMWGHGIQTLWNALGGSDEDIQGIVDWADEQQAEAGRTEIDGFGDTLAMAGGQISAALAPVLAAAAMAPIVGASAATGALVTGTLAGALSSVGELTEKATDLDPAFKGDLKTVTAGAAIGGAGSILQLKRFTPVLKPLTDLMEQFGEVTLKGSKAATRAARIAKESGSTALIGGATEAAQDAASSVAAHAQTGTTVDKTKALAIAKAAAEEFAVGAVFSGAGGTITGYNYDVAIRQREHDIEKIAELEAKPPVEALQDEYGKLDPDAIVMPVEDAGKSPGTWNLGASILFGKSTDFIRKKFANNKYVQTFVQQFHTDPSNPFRGQVTVNEDAAIQKGRLDEIAGPIINSDPVLVEEAGKRRAKGEADMTNPIDKALDDLYTHALPSEYARVSRGKGDMSSLQWNDPNYLPINQRFSWEDARKNPAKYEEGIVKHMTEAGRADQIDGALAKFRAAIREQDLQGNPLYDGAQLDEKTVKAIEEIAANDQNDTTEQMTKKLNALTRSYRTNHLKKSALNLSRTIPELPQSYWEEYAAPGTSLKDAIITDIHKKAEHLAYADKFGFQNEVAIDLITEAIIESNKPGQTPLNARDVHRMFDVMRLQQRIPTSRIQSPALRRAVMATKSYTGAMILGTSALMSIPETIITGYKTGIRNWANGVWDTIRYKSKDSQRESLASMEDIGHGLHDMTSLAAARIGETVNEMPKAETWFIQNLTGLPQVQYALGATTLKATDRHMRRTINDYRTGKNQSVRNQAKLRLLQMGVDPDAAVAWAKTNYDRNHEFYEKVWVPTLFRELRTTIVEPHAVDKPSWMGAEHWILISQLKSFVLTFQNLVLNDSMAKINQMGPGRNRELALRVAPYLSAYVLGQAGILTLKEFMREGEVNEEEMSDKVIMSIFQQGLLSLLGDVYHSLSGRNGLLETVSPAAGFITRQAKGNIQTAQRILAGDISPEEVMYEIVSDNAPRTLADPAIRIIYEEAFGKP